jgi:hypothetical protein
MRELVCLQNIIWYLVMTIHSGFYAVEAAAGEECLTQSICRSSNAVFDYHGSISSDIRVLRFIM